ncbi:adenylate cyclase associated N terminal-domain-containing protein [Exophiala viscosa]|uniref:adenylate cyclase associated N terminal-domain-containing protein n=1 Tax=Exophiala viscosa TaxID=2486360 RepID=UPI00219C2CBE|nr:adenylate cyclase associated N terminal-domain-containing protein [Exophiala viscosa]
MAVQGNMNNLTTLIKRLEAATSRLEDIATTIDGPIAPTNGVVAATSSTPSIYATAPEATPPPPEPLPRTVEAFDQIIQEDVSGFVTASGKIGGLVEQQAKAVKEAFEAERTYLLVASKAKKPDPQPPELMTELHRHTSNVDEIREANRPSPLFTHLSAVSEGIVALGWIVEKRPGDFVTDTLGGAQYYGNKILKEYKDKDKSHVEYIQAYYKIFRSLAAYVKEHFPSGLTWNNKDGVDAVEALKQIQAGAAAVPKPAGTAGGPPPPPPPPPLPNFDDDGPLAPAPAASQGGDISAVFQQLNQGSAITAGLKKVDKSEMTHKNPSLRGAPPAPQRSESQSSRGKSPIPKKPDSLRSKKPGRKELDGTKWIVENFDNTQGEIIEISAELNQSILISKCNKCVLKVNGKANAIAIDNCAGLSILVESLVSSLDVIKATKFQVQIDGVVPTLLLDQVDGAQIYLSNQTLATELFTSKCSALNVVLPPKDDSEDDSKELPLPEQLRTVVKNGRLVSEIVEHAG